jgi:hypothetical protein
MTQRRWQDARMGPYGSLLEWLWQNKHRRIHRKSQHSVTLPTTNTTRTGPASNSGLRTERPTTTAWATAWFLRSATQQHLLNEFTSAEMDITIFSRSSANGARTHARTHTHQGISLGYTITSAIPQYRRNKVSVWWSPLKIATFQYRSTCFTPRVK